MQNTSEEDHYDTDSSQNRGGSLYDWLRIAITYQDYDCVIFNSTKIWYASYGISC